MKKFLSFTLILFLTAGTFISCKKKKDPGVPPVLPPVETMLIDFGDFILATGSTANSFDNKGTDDSNWQTAAETVSDWRTLSAELPVATYKSIAGQKANHVSGAKWEWSQSSNQLTGETAGSQVKWEMTVSGNKRLDGTSNATGTEGKWTLYEGQTPLLQTDYTNSGGKITYTYLKDGQSKGAYIEFGSASGNYNFYYKVRYYNTTLGKFSEADIEWNNTSKAGRIRSADYLDGTWKCWNAQKINELCD